MNTVNKLSWRHHYIPEFFIKGFFAPAKTFWVYDKESDKIKRKEYSPRSMFFEEDGNNMTVGVHKTDILETMAYKFTDDTLSEKFGPLQREPVEQLDPAYTISWILAMLSTTIHRTPATKDQAFELLKTNLKLKIPENIEHSIRQIVTFPISNEDKLKFINAAGPFLYIISADRSEWKGKKVSYEIVQKEKPTFILSDNAMIYKTPPKEFHDLINSVIFPLTSTRIYLGLKSKYITISDALMMDINFLLALQARRYFASEDRDYLEKIAEGYRRLKPIHNDYQKYKEVVFSEINQQPGIN